MATNTVLSLDIDLLRGEKGGQPDLVRENEKKRYRGVERVEKIISLDKHWRQLRFKGDNWNKVKRTASTQVLSNVSFLLVKSWSVSVSIYRSGSS